MKRFWGWKQVMMLGLIGFLMFCTGNQQSLRTQKIQEEQNAQTVDRRNVSPNCLGACPDQNKSQSVVTTVPKSAQIPLEIGEKGSDKPVESVTTNDASAAVSPEKPPVVINPSIPPKATARFVKVIVLDKKKHVVLHLELENPAETPMWFLFPSHLPFDPPENQDAITDINIYTPLIENQPDRFLTFGEFAGSHQFRAILLPAHSSVLLKNTTLPYEEESAKIINFQVFAISHFVIRFQNEVKDLKSLFHPYQMTTLKEGERVQINVEIRGGHNVSIAHSIPSESEERFLVLPSTPMSIPIQIHLTK